MHTSILRLTILALTWFAVACADLRAQNLFEVTFGQQLPAGFWAYGGYGTFIVNPNSTHFEVNVVDTSFGSDFAPVIGTPAASLSFSLGTGVPTYYCWGPICDLIMGLRFQGDFPSSPALLSDLQSGLDELRMISTTGSTLTGPIVAVPEPSTVVFLFFGSVFLLWRKYRHAPKLRRNIIIDQGQSSRNLLRTL